MTRLSEKVLESYLSGNVDIPALAKEHGVTRERVRQLINKHDKNFKTEKTLYPVKRVESGPVADKKLKEFLAKCDEEQMEWLEAIFEFFPLDARANVAPCTDDEAMRIADEWADMVTATVTTMEALGIDAEARAAAVRRCNERNRERGRL